MKKLLFLLFSLFSLSVWSQNFKYSLLYEGIGDNREYFSYIAKPQTILGSRAAFELGLQTDEHQMRIGLSQLYEFGSSIDFHDPKLIVYYQFKNNNLEFDFGAFPRRNKIDFPLAMLTDTLQYYRPMVEGMFGQYNWSWGYQNGFVDWYSRQTNTDRESFMAGFSGEIGHKGLFFQNYLLLFHNAGPAIEIPDDHIKDYLGFSLQAGFRFGEQPGYSASVKAGILHSSFRERSVTDGFVNADSFYGEAKVNYKNFYAKSVLHSGQGHRFTYGDRFYTVDNYMRTDIGWTFINREKIKASFTYGFHLMEWNDLDQQQQLLIRYVFEK